MKIYRFLLLFIAVFFLLNVHAQEKIPWKTRRSIPLLTQHIVRNADSQKEKVMAVYDWIISNIAFNYNELSSSKYFVGINAKEVLKSKKTISSGYSELMKTMLDELGIECETVDGYVHDITWNPGDLSLFVNHSWLAIKVDGEWNLADPTWDAGYIGRIPYDRKPYKSKKYLIPLSAYKKEIKAQEIEGKRSKKDKIRKEKYDAKPKYKDKIGFVSDPAHDFFLINKDSFLLDHLPVNPVWQLRDDQITIDDFAFSRDSLKLLLRTKTGEKKKFETKIEQYRDRNFLYKLLLDGEEGNLFNPYNPGIKAVNYYTSVYLITNNKLQRYARGSVFELTSDKYPVLTAFNDTIIKYTKLFKTFSKIQFKKRKNFDKERYELTRNRDKENIKRAKKIEKESKKLNEYITKNEDKIKSDLKKIKETKKDIIEKFPGIENYMTPAQLKVEILQPWKDSLNKEIKGLDLYNRSQINQRNHSSFNSLLENMDYVDYLYDFNEDLIHFKSYSNNEYIEEVDSIITTELESVLNLYADSLKNEFVSKELMLGLKRAKNHIRLAKAEFLKLKTEGIIIDNKIYEEALQGQLLTILNLIEIGNDNGMLFNKEIIRILSLNNMSKQIVDKCEDQEKSKEEKKEYILEKTEAWSERMTDLIENLEKDSKKWKKEFKKKVKN